MGLVRFFSYEYPPTMGPTLLLTSDDELRLPGVSIFCGAGFREVMLLI
jgi:hypothetical protein